MADHQTTKLTRAKWFQIALSALIAGGAVGLVFNKGSDGFVYGTAALSILNLGFGLYMKNIDPGKWRSSTAKPPQTFGTFGSRT